MDVTSLADEIIAGRRLGRSDNLDFFVTCDLDSLCAGADKIREAFRADRVDLCTIINGKSGRCSEDCKYCAQSAHHNTTCEVYDFLDTETIVAAALANEAEGVNRFSIVTSGITLTDAEFEKSLEAFHAMKEKCKLSLCASHGLLTAEQFHRLHEAGVTSYHSNIETSRRFFPEICSTHTFEEKIENIKRARAEGLCVCSGGIIGMGETWEDRIDMALELAELEVGSIPINALMPIPGTALEDRESLAPEDILRTIALFRYINPQANIRLAAGRALLENNGEPAFRSGASATITGNMLTTSGSTIASDREMLTAMGREVIVAQTLDCSTCG
jgi:biotin synthase